MEIRPQYEHSKIGTALFNICAKWTIFLVKHKILYYFLSLTWGIVMTLVGWIITLIILFAIIFDSTIEFKWYNFIYFIKCGPRLWGGFDTGLMFIRDHDSDDSYINCHEFGHTFQNCLFGPFMPFVVTLLSIARYWYRNLFNKKDKPYDSIWFEDAATQCGTYANKYLNKK